MISEDEENRYNSCPLSLFFHEKYKFSKNCKKSFFYILNSQADNKAVSFPFPAVISPIIPKKFFNPFFLYFFGKKI
jgi:hypothetical protein